MKTVSMRLAILSMGLLMGLAAVAAWAILRPHASTANAATKPADALSAIPPPARRSLSDQVIARLTSQVQQKPGDDKAWTDLGDAFMQKARETADVTYYGHAERAYTEALALNPKREEAMVGMAWVNSGRHEFEKSIEWANRALALDPKSNDAYGLLGDASLEMGNYEDAFQQYQKMLDLRPDLSSYSRGAH